ncbi:MAG: hypothetical protein QG608_3214, partial [Actinomycetota bacterium]|nr:hypothetical protein [Actinomycetota bacterium]
MSIVFVWLPQVPGRHGSRQFELAQGDELTFGRGAPGHPVDLPFPNAAVSRSAGRLRAVEDHWVISNQSSTS